MPGVRVRLLRRAQLPESRPTPWVQIYRDIIGVYVSCSLNSLRGLYRGLYRDNGKENGSYCNSVIEGYCRDIIEIKYV